MPEDAMLARFVEALRSVPGLAALVLGGSRSRGAAGPASDHDLGLYYEPEAPLADEAVRKLPRCRIPLGRFRVSRPRHLPW